MPSLSPTALRREKATAAFHRRPEQRPVYAHRRIVPRVEIAFPVPPSANKLFANAARGGRVKTTAYRTWRDNAVLVASLKRPGRIAGQADVDIHLPPGRADGDNLVKPCLDAAVQIGVIADDRPKYLRHIHVWRETEPGDVRLVFTAIPVSDADAAVIELKAKDGHPIPDIAAHVGVSIGQVETVLARLGR